MAFVYKKFVVTSVYPYSAAPLQSECNKVFTSLKSLQDVFISSIITSSVLISRGGDCTEIALILSWCRVPQRRWSPASSEPSPAWSTATSRETVSLANQRYCRAVPALLTGRFSEHFALFGVANMSWVRARSVYRVALPAKQSAHSCHPSCLICEVCNGTVCWCNTDDLHCSDVQLLASKELKRDQHTSMPCWVAQHTHWSHCG